MLNDARDLCFSLTSRVVLLAAVAVVVAASSESLAFSDNHRVILHDIWRLESSVHQNRD